jgi:hypothetical protein
MIKNIQTIEKSFEAQDERMQLVGKLKILEIMSYISEYPDAVIYRLK